MQISAKQFAKITNVSYVVASNTMKFLELQGIAKHVDSVGEGKGRRTKIFEVPENIHISLGNAGCQIVLTPDQVDELIGNST